MNALIHSAAVEPSTARWSTESVTFMTGPTASLSFFTTGPNGALPQSSIEVLTMLSAHSLSRMRPTSVEPVKLSLRTRRSCSMTDTIGPERRPGRTFTTPGGTPAAASSLPIASAVSGVSLAGLRIIVHPAASAGTILRVAIAAGKFQGVTSTQMPTGQRAHSGR
jgi:hypothetical protein